jgi:hypothetical protein
MDDRFRPSHRFICEARDRNSSAIDKRGSPLDSDGKQFRLSMLSKIGDLACVRHMADHPRHAVSSSRRSWSSRPS